MARKYTDGDFVIQTVANISADRQKIVDQVPFSLVPFTVKSAIAKNRSAGVPFDSKAYIVAQRPNPRDFLFEVEKMNFAYRESAVDTTATAADRVIGITAAAKTVTLPTCASVRAGFVLTVKDAEGNAAIGSDAVTIARAGSDTIDGATSITIVSAYGSVTLISNGSDEWRVI